MSASEASSLKILENNLLEAMALKKQLVQTIEQDIAHFNERTNSYFHQLIKSTRSEGALQQSADLVHNHFHSGAPSRHILSEKDAKVIVRQALDLIMAIYTLKRSNLLKTLFDTQLAPYSDAYEEHCKDFMRHFAKHSGSDELAPFTLYGMKQALPSHFLQLLEANPAFDDLLMRIVECDAMVERWRAKASYIMPSIPHELLSLIANRPYVSLEKFVIEWLVHLDSNFDVENQEAIERWVSMIRGNLSKDMNTQELSIVESLSQLETQTLETLEPQKKQLLHAAAQHLGKPAPMTITQVRELEGQLRPYTQGILRDTIKAIYPTSDDDHENKVTLYAYVSQSDYGPAAWEAFHALSLQLESLEGLTELKKHLRVTLDLMMLHVFPLFSELQKKLEDACDPLKQEMAALKKDVSLLRPEENLFLSLELVHSLGHGLDFVGALKSLRPSASPILPTPSSSTSVPAIPALDLTPTQQQPSPTSIRLNAPRGGRG
jgi:hypothetical protein